MIRNIFLVITVLAVMLGYAQTVAGLTPSVDYLWLGAKWSQVPKFPGDIGVVTLSFYVSSQYVDVTISLDPKCGYVALLEDVRLPSAGPGVVTANVKVLAYALNVTCPANAIFNARYKAVGGSLTDGVTKAEYVPLYVPPYPTYDVSARGRAHLGIPSRVTLVFKSPYSMSSAATVQGQGVRVLSPSGQFSINGTYAEVPLVVIADSPSASLIVSVQSRDWLGNPVSLTYTLPIAAAPAPPSVMYVSPTALSLNKYNKVNVTIQLPVEADGTAVITAAGAVMPQSSITIPISRGRGYAVLEVYPVSSVVTFTAQITYQVAGVAKTEQISASAATQQTVGGLAKVEVRPPRLMAGVANNVTLAVSAPGAFNASVAVANAAVDKPQPYYFGGVDKATASLLVTPLSSQPVTFTVTVYHSAGTDQYTITLPVTSASIFTVIPHPSLVKSGGNRTVVVTVINSGDVAVQKAVVTISPAASNVVASTYTFQLGRVAPLESVQLPISFIIPATYSGAVAFTYNIIYTTELGTTGSAQGTFYLQALQSPAVNVTSVTVVPQFPEARRTFYISVTVVNKGFAPVTNLQVEATPPRGIRPVTAPIYFAGQLDPQQTANVPLSFNATAPGQYQIPLVISYTDQYGNYYTIPYTVTVVVTNGTRFFGPGARQGAPTQGGPGQASPSGAAPALAVGGVAIAAVVAAAIWYMRRRRKT